MSKPSTPSRFRTRLEHRGFEACSKIFLLAILVEGARISNWSRRLRVSVWKSCLAVTPCSGRTPVLINTPAHRLMGATRAPHSFSDRESPHARVRSLGGFGKPATASR
jgi:hypothetical protein